MRVLTNPGSNLPRHLRERYDIVVAPQYIVIDGERRPLAADTGLSQIDAWIESAAAHPFMLGTSASEYVTIMRSMAERDNGILAIMHSRKIIGSHDAAVAAMQALAPWAAKHSVEIAVVDSMTTDVAAGLITLAAASSAKEGKRVHETAALATSMVTAGRFVFIPRTLDYLVKSGRASFLKALAANLLNRTPLLAFTDGEATNVRAIDRDSDFDAVIVDEMKKSVGHGRAVWLAVVHADEPQRAEALRLALSRAFDVRYAFVRPIAPGTYFHVGPGVIGAAVYPVDGLAWTPAPPE